MFWGEGLVCVSLLQYFGVKRDDGAACLLSWLVRGGGLDVNGVGIGVTVMFWRWCGMSCLLCGGAGRQGLGLLGCGCSPSPH